MIKPFVPGEFCLTQCRCCCKFSQQDSVWSPALLDEEIIEFQKNNIPGSVISQNKKINLVAFNTENNCNLPSYAGMIFICPFLNKQDDKCKIYSFRPFECQIYPFLINRRGSKLFLSVDMGCPFIKNNINGQEFKDYLQYLTVFLHSPNQRSILRNNPQIIQIYNEANDLFEIGHNEIK